MRGRQFLVVIGLLAGMACGGDTGTSASPSGITTLQVVDLMVGTGAEAVNGATLTVEYAGWLYDAGAPDDKGQQFDSSARLGRPFEFVLGTGRVIPGWDQGIPGMRVGGLRRLVIPPALAYGSSGAGGVIPPNATLVFEVQLLDVN